MTVNLSTTHLGLPLKNPLVASASPLSRTVDGVRRLEDAGVAAIVLHPLFAEQISMARSPHGAGSRTVAGGPKLALNYFPRWDHDPAGPDGYLEEVGLAKRSVGVPVIAGLNGTPPGEWTQYARLTEEAGADALELNLCDIPTDPLLTGEAVERMHLGVVREVRRTVRSPVAVKIGPHFSSLPDMARRRGGAGANVCMLASELLQNGASRAGTTLQEMSRWMEQHGPAGVVQMRGLARQFSAADPAAFERAGYTKAILSRDPAQTTPQAPTVSRRGA